MESSQVTKLVRQPLIHVIAFLNQRYQGYEPWQLIFGSISFTLIVKEIFDQLTSNVPFYIRAKKKIFSLVRKIPYVQNEVKKETDKVLKNFEKEFLSHTKDIEEIVSLPEKGFTKNKIMEMTKQHLNSGEFDWKEGKQSGTVYNGGEELTNLITEVYGLTAWSNPLHPDTFPGIRKMEAEIVRMACNLFNGSSDSVGCVTGGGTESIVLAMKAYRDYGREVKGIKKPVIVVPVTAHAAFDKAASLLDIDIRHVTVDPKTMRVDLHAMKRAICSQTIVLVGSAPQFPHGSIDNIEAIAAMGVKYNIPVHVDACLGGFLICFMKKAGYPTYVDFDFSVPGVTSISADTHKYGFAPKGSSVILYSETKFIHHQWFTTTDWPGGIYATSTISGSRAGGIISSCWAALVYYGVEGYVETTREIIKTTRYIAKELENVNNIEIIGVPEVSVIAIKSDQFNIYGLSDGMKKKGWNLNALQFPQTIHLCVTYLQTLPGKADEFIRDIKEIVAEVMKNPDDSKAGTAAVYGMAQSIPDRSVIDMVAWSYLDAYYVTHNKA